MRVNLGLICLVAMAAGSVRAAPVIDWVTVGDPGNVADTDPVGYGAVSYTYQIMQYEFTNQQYVNFLNAVDPQGSNPNGIYYFIAGLDDRGGYTFVNGNADGSKYAVKANMGAKPVNWVSWFSAARVANWLQAGGQTYLTTASGSAAINSGAYTLNGQTTGNVPLRNVNAQYWIPNQDEWYKAAYYKGGGTNAGYWDYATQSDTAPTAITASLTGVGSAGSAGNFANYNNGAVWNGQTGNVTSVGTNGGPSGYGTFDMAGNILEYFDGVSSSSSIARRGGFYGSDATQIASSFSYGGVSSDTPTVGTGFRLASVAPVPEPSTIAMALAGLACGGWSMRRRKRHPQSRSFVIAAGLALMAASFAPATARAASITNVGLLPGGEYAEVDGLSSDGSVAVGYGDASSAGGAFRWTATSGTLQNLGVLPGDSTSSAYAVSGDGSVVVGQSSNQGLGISRAFRWTTTSGTMEDLGGVSGATWTEARAVSSNGSTVVGTSFVTVGSDMAVRWTSGTVQSLGRFPGGTRSLAEGVSADGSVVVGYANDAEGTMRAYRWTDASGTFQDLGTLLGGSDTTETAAWAVNADGSVVVGSNGIGNDMRAFRWTLASGTMQDLGLLPDGINARAFAVSADGATVVGEAEDATGSRAFLWTPTLGIQDLNTYLSSLGVDLTDWVLESAYTVSADGNWIGGAGDYQGTYSGFIVNITPVPEPSTCAMALAAIACGGFFLRRKRARNRRGVRFSAAALALTATLVSGVFAHAAPITIDWVTVGDPGNANDPATGNVYGAVATEYRITRFEFTNTQYAAFLNAIDPDGTNPNSVYNFSMAGGRGGISLIGGTPGSKYSVRANMGDKPVNYVSWWDAARVANWLHNGAQTYGSSNASASTPQNTGAYTTGTATSGNAVAGNSGALVYVPTESQWYKAAHYNPTLNSGSGGYTVYGNGFSTTPGVVTADEFGVGSAGGTGNFANYNQAADWNGQDGNVTTVGTNGGASYYGAFDMSGNVWEWNDFSGAASANRGLRGGAWTFGTVDLSRSFGDSLSPSLQDSYVGFRLASPVAVPEPSTYAMALAGRACGGFSIWRRSMRA